MEKSVCSLQLHLFWNSLQAQASNSSSKWTFFLNCFSSRKKVFVLGNFLACSNFSPSSSSPKKPSFLASLLMLGDYSNRHKSENFDTFWHLFENANLKQPLTFLEKFMRTLFWQLASPAYNSLMLLDVRSTAHFKVMSIRILTVMKFSNSCTDATGLRSQFNFAQSLFKQIKHTAY